MRIPLATLRRQSSTVWLFDSFSALPVGTEKVLALTTTEAAEAYLNFWKTDAAAITALRFALYRCAPSPSVFSLSDAQVMRALATQVAQGTLVLKVSDAASALVQFSTTGADVAHIANAFRVALFRCEQAVSVLSLSDQDVMQALADKLNGGTLALTPGSRAEISGGWPTMPTTAAGAAGAATPDSTTRVNLNTLADKPPEPPLLTLLEELQMEGADVLPEIIQTLEQIELTIDSINLAGVSLDPTPSKVVQIKTAMADASQAVTQALDDL